MRRMKVFLAAAIVALSVPAATAPAEAKGVEKKAPQLPDRWWDAASCTDLFIQTSTSLESTLRLNNADPKKRTLRIKWIKVQRRLSGIKIETPYVVPCRSDCTVPPGGQTEIYIMPGDFPDRQVYDEAERVDLGCEEVKARRK